MKNKIINTVMKSKMISQMYEKKAVPMVKTSASNIPGGMPSMSGKCDYEKKAVPMTKVTGQGRMK